MSMMYPYYGDKGSYQRDVLAQLLAAQQAQQQGGQSPMYSDAGVATPLQQSPIYGDGDTSAIGIGDTGSVGPDQTAAPDQAPAPTSTPQQDQTQQPTQTPDQTQQGPQYGPTSSDFWGQQQGTIPTDPNYVDPNAGQVAQPPSWLDAVSPNVAPSTYNAYNQAELTPAEQQGGRGGWADIATGGIAPSGSSFLGGGNPLTAEGLLGSQQAQNPVAEQPGRGGYLDQNFPSQQEQLNTIGPPEYTSLTGLTPASTEQAISNLNAGFSGGKGGYGDPATSGYQGGYGGYGGYGTGGFAGAGAAPDFGAYGMYGFAGSDPAGPGQGGYASGLSAADIAGLADAWGVSFDSAAALADAGFNGQDFGGFGSEGGNTGVDDSGAGTGDSGAGAGDGAGDDDD